MEVRLVSSPGSQYVDELIAALETAQDFILVSAFASVGGIERLAPAMRGVFARGGEGRIILAVDRQGFNAAAVFERLLALKAEAGVRLDLGLVLDDAGLMHAKALRTRSPAGYSLIVGSSNLTRAALGRNHELGIALHGPSSDVKEAFRSFVDSLAARPLNDDASAREFLITRGLLQRPPRPSAPRGEQQAHQAAGEVLAKLPPLAPLAVEPEVALTNWVQQGYLVGRGRRSIDAIVLRFPQEQAIRSGYLLADKRERLGASSYETRKTGFGVELLPAPDAEALRRDARRVSHLLAKVTLNLPCFGLWMPEAYWPAFLAAREEMVRAHSLDPAHVREVAAMHAADLRGGGLERETDIIIERLGQLNLLVEAKRPDLREYLLRRFNGQLTLRTPDVLAACVEFRTARQRWTPYESTEAPYRQLAVDVMQATFSATYRTGDWPNRFKSIAGRRLAEYIEQRFESLGQSADGETATSLLDLAMSWEGPASLEAVVGQFRLLTEGLRFEESDVEGLGGGDDDDNEGDDIDEL